MYTLGISAFYHDSAATLLKNGRLLCAFEEERFSRIKHDNSFPYQAISACLSYTGISINDVESVAYYEKPLLKFERIIQMMVESYPKSRALFVQAVPEWFSEKLHVENVIRKQLGFQRKLYFVPHHLSHASATYLTSPFEHAAIFTADAVGEYETLSLWHAKNNTITKLKSIHFPHSIGLFYSTITAFLGFRVNEDEQKVMGLAAYGKPVFAEKLQKIIQKLPDESIRLDMSYFSFTYTKRMWSKKLETVLGKPRNPESPLINRHKDIAASTQFVTETLYLNILTHLANETGEKNLCLGGGLALNALANGKIYSQTPFENTWNFGPAGDNGGSSGAALYCFFANTKKRRNPVATIALGNIYDDESIENELKKFSNLLTYRKYHKKTLLDITTDLLTKKKVVGWFQERGEFGPRALGNRSILAHPGSKKMKSKINKMKKREMFRPFGMSILEEHAALFLSLPNAQHSHPFMNTCFLIKKEKEQDLRAVTHKDNTCRVQTVTKENGLFFELLTKMYKKSGIPCLLNTSFNHSGQPLVETPNQAIEDLLLMEFDALILGSFLVKKNYSSQTNKNRISQLSFWKERKRLIESQRPYRPSGSRVTTIALQDDIKCETLKNRI